MNSVSRQVECEHLDEQFNRSVSSFIAIYGRRRIGKTFLVRDYCKRKGLTLLEFTGMDNSSTADQLEHFTDCLNDLSLQEELSVPKNWKRAFTLLNRFIDQHFSLQKTVIFLDEAPWMDTERSDFKNAIAHLWDKLIDNNPNKQLVICGSAATYMIKNFAEDRGPLHQRTTKIIPMQDFNLDLTNQYMQLTNWQITERSICEVYLAVGGVAKYLSDMNKQSSPEHAIDEACFSVYGKLQSEYKTLFKSLFKNANAHYKIMDTLCQKWAGYRQSDLIEITGLAQSTISVAVSELEASGFLETRQSFSMGKVGARILASDMFCFFHHKWIKDKQVKDWVITSAGQSYKSWAGFAFERVCQLHSYQIKKKLGIHGVSTSTHYWEHKGDGISEGAQVDMLLKHEKTKDIHIIECKYYSGQFTITKDYHDDLKRKIRVLWEQTNKKYNIHLVLVTTEGVVRNKHANGLNFKEVLLKDLFSSEP